MRKLIRFPVLHMFYQTIWFQTIQKRKIRKISSLKSFVILYNFWKKIAIYRHFLPSSKSIFQKRPSIIVKSKLLIGFISLSHFMTTLFLVWTDNLSKSQVLVVKISQIRHHYFVQVRTINTKLCG